MVELVNIKWTHAVAFIIPDAILFGSNFSTKVLLCCAQEFASIKMNFHEIFLYYTHFELKWMALWKQLTENMTYPTISRTNGEGEAKVQKKSHLLTCVLNWLCTHHATVRTNDTNDDIADMHVVVMLKWNYCCVGVCAILIIWEMMKYNL